MGCGKTKQPNAEKPTPTTNTNKGNGGAAKPVKEQTLENRLEAKVRDALEEKLPNDISINKIHIIANPKYKDRGIVYMYKGSGEGIWKGKKIQFLVEVTPSDPKIAWQSTLVSDEPELKEIWGSPESTQID